MTDKIHEEVKDYYGKVLQKSNDLKSDACIIGKSNNVSKTVKEALSLISDEVQQKYFGCGIVIPPALEDCKILDMGCGAGRDSFCLSKLVGKNGFVTGLDMTEEQVILQFLLGLDCNL